MNDLQVDPICGNVAFGSAYYCWGFTLMTFAKIYEEKFKNETGPAIAEFLKSEGVDGVLMTAG